ncbi:MAG: hypothetical protein AB8B88_12720 [Devosiaceae bacterium]
MDDAAPRAREGRVSFLRIFLRLCLCSLAFFLASTAASFIGIFGLYRGLEGDAVYPAAYITTALLATMFIASYALVPFAVFVVLVEAFAVRALLVFAFFGAAVGAAFAFQEAVELSGIDDPRLLVCIAGGIVGGFVYWLIAGRTSGAYREKRFAVSAVPASPSEPGSPAA